MNLKKFLLLVKIIFVLPVVAAAALGAYIIC